MPAMPWDDIHANRVLVAHIYHRIDAEILWATLNQDIPRRAAELQQWLARDLARESARAKRVERDTGLDIGF